MAVTALEQAGFIVIECADATDIVAVCEQRRPDIALLDVMMPGVDGFSACQALRSTPAGKHLPVLMMTGLEDIDSVVKAYDAGATDFINKPLNYTLLSYRLRYMLRSKRTGDELRASRSLLEEAQRVAGLAYWGERGERPLPAPLRGHGGDARARPQRPAGQLRSAARSRGRRGP